MTCGGCGAQNDSGRKLCLECGAGPATAPAGLPPVQQPAVPADRG